MVAEKCCSLKSCGFSESVLRKVAVGDDDATIIEAPKGSSCWLLEREVAAVANVAKDPFRFVEESPLPMLFLPSFRRDLRLLDLLRALD